MLSVNVGSKLLKDPLRIALLEITFAAVPQFRYGIYKTNYTFYSIYLLGILLSSLWISIAIGNGSNAFCGALVWPPFPLTIISI